MSSFDEQLARKIEARQEELESIAADRRVATANSERAAAEAKVQRDPEIARNRSRAESLARLKALVAESVLDDADHALAKIKAKKHTHRVEYSNPGRRRRGVSGVIASLLSVVDSEFSVGAWGVLTYVSPTQRITTGGGGSEKLGNEGRGISTIIHQGDAKSFALDPVTGKLFFVEESYKYNLPSQRHRTTINPIGDRPWGIRANNTNVFKNRDDFYARVEVATVDQISQEDLLRLDPEGTVPQDISTQPVVIQFREQLLRTVVSALET